MRVPASWCTVIGCAALLAGAPACGVETDTASSLESSSLPAAAKPTLAPARLSIGRAVSSAEVAAIDIDANPDGVGLPSGRGTHAEGAVLFAARCASCHGAKGEGLLTYPQLIGAPLDTAFDFGNDVKHVKTVGNYWPYATTLYDYIHRTMPYNAPGSLAPNEVYGLVAFLLAENGVIARTATMNARALPSVRMPARAHFVRDNRAGGATFR